jgi:uncharacterized membrane protein
MTRRWKNEARRIGRAAVRPQGRNIQLHQARVKVRWLARIGTGPARMAAQTPQTTDKTNQPQITLEAQQWTGPLPPPAALEQFERVIPGGAERIILRMAEQEQAHRIGQENRGLAAKIDDSRRGQWLGGIVAFSAITGAAINSVFGGPRQASVALVGVPILGAVHAFIRGRESSAE